LAQHWSPGDLIAIVTRPVEELVKWTKPLHEIDCALPLCFLISIQTTLCSTGPSNFYAIAEVFVLYSKTSTSHSLFFVWEAFFIRSEPHPESCGAPLANLPPCLGLFQVSVAQSRWPEQVGDRAHRVHLQKYLVNGSCRA
jgi:hypothetical protein